MRYIPERLREPLVYDANKSPIMELARISPGECVRDSRLNVTIGGIKFENPVLVGPRPDSNKGQAVLEFYRAGFGGIEVGSIPVGFHNPDEQGFMEVRRGAKIYRYPLIQGVTIDAVAANLEQYRGSGIPIGVNIIKNGGVSDEEAPRAYEEAIEKLYEYASYFVINVSSENRSGLKVQKDKELIKEIIQVSQARMNLLGGEKPMFLKISQDLTNEEIDQVIDFVRENGMTGIIATNFTVLGSIKNEGNQEVRDTSVAERQDYYSNANEEYRIRATEIINYIYTKTMGEIIIIGSGGIKDAESALEKIKAGASAIQVGTAISYEGLGLAGKINNGILEEMQRLEMDNFESLIGYSARSKSL